MSLTPGIYRIKSTVYGGFIGSSSENLDIVLQGINPEEEDTSQKVSCLPFFSDNFPIEIISGSLNHSLGNGR